MLLQLTGSYFCSVTGYNMLASFTALLHNTRDYKLSVGAH